MVIAVPSTPLNDVVERLGYRTETSLYPVQKLLCGEIALFEGTSVEIWQWLLMTRQVEFKDGCEPGALPGDHTSQPSRGAHP